MVTYLIHVMGEETPRPTTYDSLETAQRAAAELGLHRRLYTVVMVEDLDEPALPDVPPPEAV